MSGYTALATFETLWQQAVSAYKDGNREPDSYFTPTQLEEMRNHGLKVMDLYDYAEDFVSSEDPDFATFIAVHTLRRNFFLIEQQGQWEENDISVADLPAKTDEIDGIVWLPRIMPKARGKLRGTLPPEIMYGCGGDRRFFKTHGITSSEFLQAVWLAGDDDQKIVDYVKSRSSAPELASA